MVSTLFIFHAKDDRSGVVDSWGTYISTCSMHVIYNDWMYMYVANVFTCLVESSYSKVRFGPLHDGWLATWS